MYINRNANRNEWNDYKENTFRAIETNKSKFLNMHLRIEDEDINIIQKFVHFNYEDITTSQLRNVYNLILDVPNDKPSQLSLKRIKLAYVAGRTDKKKKGMLHLLRLLDSLFEMVKEDSEKLKGVKTFTEALVAYHKYYDSLKIKPKNKK